MKTGAPVYILKEHSIFMTCAYEHLSLEYDANSISYSFQQGINTDSDLQIQKRRDKMNSYIAELLALAATHGLNLTGDSDIELVVQSLLDKSNAQICKYYFIDHSKRLLFWVHVQLGENIFDGVQGAEKMSHISAPSNTSEQSSCPDNYVYRVCCRTTVLASLSFVCLLLLCEKLF